MLTTLAKVKSRLKLTDFEDDALLTDYIKGVSGRFERDCNRVFGRGDTSDEFAGDSTELIPSRYPIEEVTRFRLKTTETESWIVLSDVQYIVRKETVISLLSPIGTAQQQMLVEYTGGYVLPGTDDDGPNLLPDELQQACVDQVAYLYQNRHRLGMTSVTGEGGSIQTFAQLDLLPHVKAVVKKYERYRN